MCYLLPTVFLLINYRKIWNVYGIVSLKFQLTLLVMVWKIYNFYKGANFQRLVDSWHLKLILWLVLMQCIENQYDLIVGSTPRMQACETCRSFGSLLTLKGQVNYCWQTNLITHSLTSLILLFSSICIYIYIYPCTLLIISMLVLFFFF